MNKTFTDVLPALRKKIKARQIMSQE